MNSDTPTVTVIGAGYVGLSTAALLSNCGYMVYLIDTNLDRLETIRQGKSFFYEDGIDSLIKHGIDQGTLRPTQKYSDAIPNSSIIFSCVGTPDNPDGSSNLTYVFSAAAEAAPLLKPESIYVQKSTVPVGTGKNIIEQFGHEQIDVHYVSNPEFLREGTAISDTLWFDRIVCGGKDEEAVQKVFAVYKKLESCREELAKQSGIKNPPSPAGGNYIATSLESAELIKVTSNAFLALKISFANSIAKLADTVGADVTEVMDAVGQDKRIGRAFLNAGRGYGGGCFPKDMSGLIQAMYEHGADPQILVAAQDVNASMPGYIVNKLQEALGTLKGKKIAVLGLAFKAGTSDARRSPGVNIANIITKLGGQVCVYDPQALEEASEELHADIAQKTSLEQAIDGVDAVVIATDWPEFKQLKASELSSQLANKKVLYDCMNIYNSEDIQGTDLVYLGVGR